MQADSGFELVDNFARLCELKSEWSAFIQAVPNLTPFQLPEWMIIWWRHFGSGSMHTLVFRDAGRMVGIVPAFLHDWNGRRQITLIGSGISDYLDPAMDTRFRKEVIGRLRAHLESAANWDVCDWQDLSVDTPLRQIQPGSSFEITVNSETECTEISLPATFEEFWMGRSKDLRRNVVRYRKKAEAEKGPVVFQVTCEPRPEIIEGLMRLHTARWQSRGEPGMIEANRSAGFLREVIARFAARGLLRLFSLRINEEIAAVIICWLYTGTLFFYMSGFDPRFVRFSPGQILLSECVRYSYEHDCQSWNFLRGSEDYKFAWGAQPVPKCRVLITRS